MQTRLILRHWRHLLGAIVALAPVALVRAGDISSPATENKETVQVEKTDSNPLSFWDGRLVFDLEERVRWEIRNNNRDFDASKNDDNDDNWFLNRFRLGLAIKPVDWLKLYGQMQDIREWNSDRSNIPGVRGAEGDDFFDLRQAYVAIGDPKQFPFIFTAGRQSFTYGDSRLVADSRWNNFGRTFDALRLRFEESQFWVEAFAMRPVQIKRGDFDDSDSADNFFGVYASTTALSFQTTDFYVFYRNKGDNQPDLDPTNKINPEGTFNGPAARFVTIGARVLSTPVSCTAGITMGNSFTRMVISGKQIDPPHATIYPPSRCMPAVVTRSKTCYGRRALASATISPPAIMIRTITIRSRSRTCFRLITTVSA